MQKLEVLTWLVQSDVLPPTYESDFGNLFAELFTSYENYRADRAEKYNANNWKVANMQGYDINVFFFFWLSAFLTRNKILEFEL